MEAIAVIEFGWTTPDAYDALARFHYRAGRPATVARRPGGGFAVVQASEDGETVGVLIASMPTVIGTWRRLPWPGAYNGIEKSETAKRLNAEVRCLSRVVVDPRWRGRGVAAELVRWYLARALTPRTEAVAAMGVYCPFFERAGMTAYQIPVRSRDARLLDAIHAAALRPIDLMVPTRVREALQTTPWLGGELGKWARSCRSTRTKTTGMAHEAIAMIAGGVVNAPLTGYAHSQQAPSGQAISQQATTKRATTQQGAA